MIYQIKNAVADGYDYVETEDLANAKLIDNRSAYFAEQSFRFPISKVTVSGENTTWQLANLDSDPEDFEYQLFNHKIGLHEVCNSLSQAVVKKEALIKQFLDECGLDKWTTLDSIPIVKIYIQPKTKLRSF